MISKPPPSKGLNLRIPFIIPTKGRGFTNHGSTLRTSEPVLCRGFILSSGYAKYLLPEVDPAQSLDFCVTRPFLHCPGSKERFTARPSPTRAF